MKNLTIEASASSSPRSTTLSRVISYAKSHRQDICIGIASIACPYAILAIEADNYRAAMGALIICAIALLLFKKGGNYARTSQD